MNTNVNLKDSQSFYASDDLISKLPKDANYIVNFSYTDYGGDFFDKVAISFFSEKYPNNIVKEDTMYFGENAFIFGDVAKEFIEESENYLLGFDGMEEYYYNKQYETVCEGINYFLKDCVNTDKFIISDSIPDEFREYAEGLNITTQGLDFCESEMIDKGIETGLLIPINS